MHRGISSLYLKQHEAPSPTRAIDDDFTALDDQAKAARYA